MEHFASGAIQLELQFSVCQCKDNLTVTTQKTDLPNDDGRSQTSYKDLNDIRVLVHKTDTNRIKVSSPTASAPINWLELRVSNLVKVTSSNRSSSIIHQCPISNLPISVQPSSSSSSSTLLNGITSPTQSLKPSIKVNKSKWKSAPSTGTQLLSEALSDSEIIIVSDEFRRNATDHQEVVIDHKRKWMKLMKLQQQQLRLERMKAAAAATSIEMNGNHNGSLDNRSADETNHNRLDGCNKSVALSRRGGGSSSSGHQHRHGRKQLVIVSDAFRRDACRQTDGVVVVVDDEVMSRRRQRQLQQMRKDGSQETSIDDVGNKLTSHAFHSYDEEDESLERKQLDAIDGAEVGAVDVIGN